jgi:beta-lactamase regulating signal transducer with metallopeptidase domain
MTAASGFPDAAGTIALLVRATLLMGVAWASAAMLRKAGASAAARHLAWLLGIFALLALPLLWWLVPALRLPILPAEAATGAAAGAASFAVAPPPEEPAHAAWSVVLPIVYALGATALLARLVVGRRMLGRLWRDSGPVPDRGWETLLSRLALEVGLRRRVELRIARGPAVPMTWGTLAPKILLPAEASEWPPERRRLVLLHELAHVARRDSFSRSLASLACALYWFHPGAWFAARRMRLEQEHAADDHVLVAGGSAQAYALSLLHLARSMKAGPRFDQAVAMAGMDLLERRLVSITSPARRARPGAAFLSSSALLAASATLIVAAGVPVSATPIALGPSPSRQAGFASPRDPGSVRPDDRPARETRSEKASAVASEPRPNRGAPAHRDEAVSRDSEPAVPAEATRRRPQPSPAYAEQLHDYGWELSQRDPRAGLASASASSRPDRLALPAPILPASSERAGRARWARTGPRVVRDNSSTRSPVTVTPGGTVMLSWSVDVGAK